ncbi:glycoside hydrolase family 3 N-terminal domain-containing protein [Actinoplanes sp. NPDC051851]|uniref:glycoside hydrolase family 3 protein n=1 Tax=Actinoplanes sp. NPDC051851 TaxID=3154753 RepID=UPI00341CD7BA
MYKDASLPVEERVSDLLSRMTPAEKAGLLFHAPISVRPDGGLVEEPAGLMPTVPTTRAIAEQGLRHFNLCSPVAAGPLARWHNTVQKIAAQSRLGVPVLISTDPRHSAVGNPLTSVPSGGFSQWPEPLGLAAIGDEQLLRQFGEIARQEYLSVGLRMALHPSADIASEPRWARTAGTFGADPALVARFAAAYVSAFQAGEVGSASVATMLKHWPGGGPQKDGEDCHFPGGREQDYPAGQFETHLNAFRPSLEAGTAAIMPYYGMPVGVPGIPEVGFAYNDEIINGLLRRGEGYEGVICTDWGLVTDDRMANGAIWQARAWGVEHLDTHERVRLLFDAGVDQIGGESCPQIVLDLLADGRLKEDRLDSSVRRILTVMFRLGLFENPYVDEEQAVQISGRPDFVAAGLAAQRRSMTLLTNRSATLPLASGVRLYVEGVDPAVAARYATVVDRPTDADVALVRLSAPFEARPHFPEALFHQGRLDLPADRSADLVTLMTTVPTVVDVFLERAAVIPEIAEHAAALLADYAASDEAVLDVVFGHAAPEGRLPIELPSSMAAVEAHPTDLPGGSADPLFPIGFSAPIDGWASASSVRSE